MSSIVRDGAWIPLCWAGWFILVIVLRAKHKDRLQLLLGHALFGAIVYVIGVAGLLIAASAEPFGLLAAGGWGMFCLGHALFMGWVSSPGGARFILTPFGFLKVRPSDEGMPEEDKGMAIPYWSRSSTVLALFLFLALGSAFVWVFINIGGQDIPHP